MQIHLIAEYLPLILFLGYGSNLAVMLIVGGQGTIRTKADFLMALFFSIIPALFVYIVLAVAIRNRLNKHWYWKREL